MKTRSGRSFELVEIGTVNNDYEEEIPENYKENISSIEVFEDYEDALLGIEENSHIAIFCWFDKSERDIYQVHPLGDDTNPLTGVFATRAPVRPNPISHTVCELVKRENNQLYVKGLDALNGTPVIDIKVHKKYEVENPKYPEWAPEE